MYESDGCFRKILQGVARIRPVTFKRTCKLTLLLAGSLGAAEVKVVFVGPTQQSSPARMGAMQGLEEAQLQGRFLGLDYTLTTAAPTDLAVVRGADAILVAGSPDIVQTVATAVREQDVPVFNVSATQDWLRTDCRSNLLHTIPSDSMFAAATAQWKQTSDARAIVAQAWHPDFVKFAARDLNKRFEAAQGVVMNDEAWSAWAAMRIIADAAANLPEGSSSERLKYIRSEMEFDGQKGEYMSFRETGQLRQTLLIVENKKLVGEAPVRGVAASDDLDSLASLVCAQ